MYTKGFKHTSVCYITKNNQGRRIFDIENNELKKVVIDPDRDYQYENRDIIFLNDGPKDFFKVGVWSWKAEQNHIKPDKDYVTSKFVDTLKPISIDLSFLNLNLHTIIHTIKQKGIKKTINNERQLIVFKEHNRLYGIDCNFVDWEENNGTYYISDDQLTINYYEISPADIVQYDLNQYDLSQYHLNSVDVDKHVDTKYSLYKYLQLDETKAKVKYLKTEYEIINNLIMEYAVWNQSKDYMTRKQFKAYKEALNNLPYDNIYNHYADIMKCSHQEAVDSIGKYLANIQEYLDGTDISTEIIQSVIRRDETLVEECKELVKKELANDFKQIHDQYADKKLQQNQELTKLGKELSKQQQQVKKLENSITDLTHVEENLLKSINAKLENAKQNTADFISDTLIFSKINETLTQPMSKDQTVASENVFYRGNDSEVEIIGDILTPEDVVIELADQLVKAGINDQYKDALAVYLYGAYLKKIPLLLAGPNGEIIANICSAVLLGKTAHVIDCNGSNELNINAYLPADEVVVIKHPFASSWENKLPALLNQKDNFYVLVTPFAEDMIIEPRSWMNYLVPLLTEVMIADEMEEDIDYVGFVMNSNYEEYSFNNENKYQNYQNILDEMMIPRVCSQRIATLLGMKVDVLNKINQPEDVLLALLPCAYFNNAGEYLKDYIENNLTPTDKISIAFYTKLYFGEQ